MDFLSLPRTLVFSNALKQKKSYREKLLETQKEIELLLNKKINKVKKQKKNKNDKKAPLFQETINRMHFELLVDERNELRILKKNLLKEIRQLKKEQATTEEKNRLLLQNITRHKKQIRKTFPTSQLLQLVEPQFFLDYHPLRCMRNFRKYIQDSITYYLQVHSLAKIPISYRYDESRSSQKRNNLPDFVTVHDRYVEVGDKWERIYYLADIPSELTPFIHFKLLASELPLTMSLYTKPTPNDVLLKKARQRISVLEAQQLQRETKGLTRDPQIERNIEETKQFAQDITYDREKGFVFSFYIKLAANSKESLDTLHRSFINLCESMEVIFNTYAYGQFMGLKNFLPVNQDVVKEDRIIQSSAASYLMPFVAKSLYNPDGIFIGTNVYHNSLVFLNPFTEELTENNNVNIFGVSGSGKSVTSKILAFRLFLRGTQVIIIDPEGEYVNLAKSLGGEVIQFSRDNGMNPFSPASDDKDTVLNHITMLKTFFKFFIRKERYDSVLLDKILVSLYECYPKNQPDFQKFLNMLKATPFYEDLSVLLYGSLQGIFTSKRKLALQNDFIVFDLRALSENEVKAPSMYLLTTLIWQIVNSSNERQRMLFIDEAHTLLKDNEVASDFQKLVKQARKRNLGVVSITQDVEDFLHHERGKAIINNSATKILLKQSFAAIGLMDTIFPMTTEEKKNLGSLHKGEVVIFRGSDHIEAFVHVLPSEKPFVFT